MSVVDNLNLIKTCKEEIKQAIMDKGVDMTEVPFTAYAGKISEIQQGGGSGDYLEIRNNLTTYSNSEVGVIYDYVFCDMTNLKTVNLPNCNRIGNTAFQNCVSLTNINIPKCSLIDGSAFQNCSLLTSIDLPNLMTIYYLTFSNCSSLSSVNLPSVKQIYDNAFQNCNIQTLDLPECNFIGSYVFANNPNLTSINLPKCEEMGDACFEYCYALTDINLPKVRTLWGGCFREIAISEFNAPNLTHIGGDTFARCPNLTTVNTPLVGHISSTAFCDCPNLTSIKCCAFVIEWEAFTRCSSFRELDIRDSYSCELQYISAFSETPFMNGEGTIYVHNSVLSNFINDPNWSNFADRFVGVGDADKPLLAFADGRIYGDTKIVNVNPTEFLGISRDDVTNIDLPNCKLIETNAFFACYNLTEINLPVEHIKQSAFCQCLNLTTVNLPYCSKLDNNVFGECPNLKTLYIGTELTEVCDASADAYLPYEIEAIFVPEKLKGDYKNAPYWKQFADKIFAVGEDPSNPNPEPEPEPEPELINVYDESVISLSESYFTDNNIDKNYVASLDLPNCKVVDADLFEGNESLETVNLPSVTTINSYAFCQCLKLTTININPDCSVIGSWAFADNRKLKLTEITLNSLTTLNDGVFFGCKKLNTFTADNITSVGEQSLAYCPNLWEIRLPKCQTVGRKAFKDNIGMTQAVLPQCTYLSEGVFSNCEGLTSLFIGYEVDDKICNADENPEIPDTIQYIYVNRNLVDTYKSDAYWSKFADRIFEYTA